MAVKKYGLDEVDREERGEALLARSKSAKM